MLPKDGMMNDERLENLTRMVVESDGLDYYGGGTYKASPNYSFQHKLSDIFTCAIEAGMGRIEHFREHPDHISNTFWNVEKQGPELPMSYTLVFRKS